MPIKTILYGDIILPDEKKSIIKNSSYDAKFFLWENKPKMVKLDDHETVVFVDLDDPVFSTGEFLLSLATAGKRTKLIGKSSNFDIDEEVRLSKLGVAEVLSPDDCLVRINDLLRELEEVSDQPKNILPSISSETLIGNSPAMSQIKENIALLSQVDFPSALLLGETGTGKSLISKVLHQSGQRANNNFVEVNCSAIPDALFESELFGHVKGAFTDAKEEKMGLFEHAEKGTLFLDEVGNLSPTSQAKLLKVLENKKLRKIGDVAEIDIDVRIVAATNLDLRKAVDEGKFREDLFFRLNLLTIDIPPLRERKSEVPEMIEYYLIKFTMLYAKENVTIDKIAMAELLEYDWPGNVRELCNVIERLVLLSDNKTIKKKNVLGAINKSRVNLSGRKQLLINLPSEGISLEEIDQQVIKQVLNMFKWNKTETAKYLNISRPKLRRIIESAGLHQDRRKS